MWSRSKKSVHFQQLQNRWYYGSNELGCRCFRESHPIQSILWLRGIPWGLFRSEVLMWQLSLTAAMCRYNIFSKNIFSAIISKIEKWKRSLCACKTKTTSPKSNQPTCIVCMYVRVACMTQEIIYKVLKFGKLRNHLLVVDNTTKILGPKHQ